MSEPRDRDSTPGDDGAPRHAGPETKDLQQGIELREHQPALRRNTGIAIAVVIFVGLLAVALTQADRVGEQEEITAPSPQAVPGIAPEGATDR